MVLRAFVLALEAHRGQKDKAGRCYIWHPIRVAKKVRGETLKTVALLHDTIEDTYVSFPLLERKFGIEVAVAVDSLSRRKGEDLQVYLERVKGNEIARQVKIADLLDNANIFRYKQIPTGATERTIRYCHEIEFLLQE